MTSNGENKRVVCNKTFCQKIPDFSPDSGFFRNFFKSPWSLDHLWDIMFNKIVYILISLGGDSASTRYVVTHTTSGIYILILFESFFKTHLNNNFYNIPKKTFFSRILYWMVISGCSCGCLSLPLWCCNYEFKHHCIRNLS